MMKKKNAGRSPRGREEARLLGLLAVAWLAVAAIGLHGCDNPLARMSLEEMREKNAKGDMQAARPLRMKLRKSLTVRDAIEYALKNSFEARLMAKKKEIERELVTGSKLRLLPTLQANLERSRQDRLTPSYSKDYRTEEKAAEPTYSQGRHTNTFQMSLIWNLLDFGATYLKSRQAQDRYLMSEQNLRRVRQNLVLSVTKAYWRAVVAQEALKVAEDLAVKSEVHEDEIEKLIEKGAISKYQGLEIQSRLLSSRMNLEEFEQEYARAKATLSGLMGMAPGTKFRLDRPDFKTDLVIEPLPMRELEKETLRRRPELFNEDLNERISYDEARIALIKMFPSPSLFLRYEHDANKLLYVHDWWTVGLNASMQLLSLPAKYSDYKATKLESGMIVERRHALAVAILSQLHLAAIDYNDAQRRYGYTRQLMDYRNQQLDFVRKQRKAGKAHHGVELEAEEKALRARIEFVKAHTDLLVAQRQLDNTIGRDPEDMVSLERQRLAARATGRKAIMEDPETSPWLRFALRDPEGKISYGPPRPPLTGEVDANRAQLLVDTIRFTADIEERRDAISELIAMGAGVAPHVMVLLDDEVMENRIYGIIILRETRAPQAYPVFFNLLGDKNQRIRFHTSLALRSMTGVDMHYLADATVQSRRAAIQRWDDYLKQHNLFEVKEKEAEVAETPPVEEVAPEMPKAPQPSEPNETPAPPANDSPAAEIAVNVEG